jgi:ceramide synthetase
LLQPIGERVLTAAAKKTDKNYTKEQQRQQIRKWNESCWKMFIFGSFTVSAFMVVRREPYFLDPKEYWTGTNAFPMNYYVPLKLVAFYCLEIGFYIQAIPYLCFVETRRKDWAETFAHHIVTLGLLYYSFYCNFTRPGIIVTLIHDVSDIFLEAAKLARYAEDQNWAFYLFVAFTITWIITRVCIYPYLFIHRFLVDPITMVAQPYGIDPQPHYSFFGTLFILLYCLHLYWTYLIIMIIVRQLKTGDTDDIREEDDD